MIDKKICKEPKLVFNDLILPSSGKFNSNKNYYIYCYCDPRKIGIWKYNDFIFMYEPIYIGKGKDNRLYSHLKEARKKQNIGGDRGKKLNKLIKILKEGYTPFISKIAENLNEEDAYFLEEDIINELWHYNCLTNVSKDSFCPSNVLQYMDKKEISKKISEAGKLSYKNNPQRAKDHSKKILGSKNGRYGRGDLTSGNKNGKYIEVDVSKIIELYKLKYSCKQIGIILSVSSIVPKHRLKEAGIILPKGRHTTKLEFIKKENLILFFKKGEITYEQLIANSKK